MHKSILVGFLAKWAIILALGTLVLLTYFALFQNTSGVSATLLGMNEIPRNE